MSEFSLNPQMNMEVIGRFISRDGSQPITGNDYTVRLFDKDLFNNEFLGESGLDENGYTKISFSPASFSNFANLDTFPDLYFVVYNNGEIIYKSKVMEDVNVDAIERYQKGAGEVIDLGTYLLDT